jgi:hypothetical protein
VLGFWDFRFSCSFFRNAFASSVTLRDPFVDDSLEFCSGNLDFSTSVLINVSPLGRARRPTTAPYSHRRLRSIAVLMLAAIRAMQKKKPETPTNSKIEDERLQPQSA